MTNGQAERAVTTSAVMVGAIYFYRRIVEGGGQAAPSLAHPNAAKQLAGVGSVPPLSHFIVGYGFAFMVIAVIAQAEPDVGGPFAWLVLLGTILAQGSQLASDLNGQLGGGKVSGAIPPAPPAPSSLLAGGATGSVAGNAFGNSPGGALGSVAGKAFGG